MRKDDPQIQHQRQDNAYMTWYNGQWTDEFGQIIPLGFGSAHPTGQERGFASNRPEVRQAKVMFRKRLEKKNG